MECATHLFAKKGFTETSVREIAAAVGVNEASLYNHFPSKNAILEFILEDFYSQAISGYFNQNKLPALKNNPTVDGIFSCLRFVFPEDKAEHYMSRLYVILQEQHRNPLVRKFVLEQMILGNEQVFKTIINKLKEFNIINPDTDTDYWAKLYSSLLYTFASRALLDISGNKPSYSGMSMLDMIHNMCEMMLATCGAGNFQTEEDRQNTQASLLYCDLS